MPVTPSRLRSDIYRILDQALETGRSVEVIRKGKVLKIVPPAKTSRLAKLRKRNAITGDPEDLVSLDWSAYWEPGP